MLDAKRPLIDNQMRKWGTRVYHFNASFPVRLIHLECFERVDALEKMKEAGPFAEGIVTDNGNPFKR